MKKTNKITKTAAMILTAAAIFVLLSVVPEPKDIALERTSDSYSDLFFTYDVVRYPAKAELWKFDENSENYTLGFNTETGSLNFGTIVGHDAIVKRQINLTLRDEIPSSIKMKSRGSIAPLIEFSEDEFILVGNKQVSVTLNTGTYPEGNYTGEVSIIVKRSKYGPTRLLLGY